MGNEQVGLDAVWNNTKFNKGQSEYISGLDKALGVTDRFAQKTASASNQGASALTGGLSAAGGGVLQFGFAIGATIAIVGKLIDGLIGAGKAVYGFADSSLKAASNVQQLNYIAQTLGHRAGYTSEQIFGFVNGIKDVGISAAVSNNLVAQFLRSNLDLSKATDLARVAQDSATLANIGSSDALDKLIYGIQTLQPEVLRTAGVTISLEQAYKEYAKTLGKTVTELTPAEKKQIALNAVLAEGVNVAGAYEASMNTAGKQLGSLTSRLIPDLQAAMGAPFQVGFFNAISGINGMVAGITKLISEGGALYPVMINLGGALALITEPLKALGDAFKSGEIITSFTDLFANITDTVMGFVQSAYEWGIGLSAQFADGIIQGAATMIQQAIAWVSNLISSWFQPHSPPKIASSIDKWGAGTINQWLTGMTDADFSILDSVQGPLERALQAMVSAGDIGEEDAFKKMQDINAKMMEALSSGDTLENDFFENIKNSAGDFGSAIADLAKKQYDLQLAERGVASAEKELEDARKRSADAGKQVNELTAEYNQMLRSGASKEQLDAKKKEIGLAKQSQTQAQKDEESAKAKLDAQKEGIALLKEQLALQKKVVDQLLEAAKVFEGKDPKSGLGAGGAGPDAGIGGGFGSPIDEGILDPMKDAVEQARKEIGAKISLMWQQIQNTFAIGVMNAGQYWDRLTIWAGDAWNEIATTFGLPSWETIQASWQTATQWIATQVLWLVTTLETWWKEHGANVSATLTGFWELTKTLFNTWLSNISESFKFWVGVWNAFWAKYGLDITAAFTTIWTNIQTAVTNALDFIGNYFDLFAAIFAGDWQTAWDEIIQIGNNVWAIIGAGLSTWWTTVLNMVGIGMDTILNIFTVAWTAVSTLLSSVWDVINTGLSAWVGGIKLLVEGLQTRLGEIWDGIVKKVTETWDGIVQSVTDKITGENGLINTITGNIDDLLTTLKGYVQTFKDWGGDLIAGATQGVLDGVQGLIDAVVGAIQDAIKAATEALDWHSPSRVFRKMFQDTMLGAELGVKDKSDLPSNAIKSATIQAIGTARQTMATTPITAGNTYNRSLSISMPTTITGGMTAAQFQAMVSQTVRNELQRR